jgi:hypothetical protein
MNTRLLALTFAALACFNTAVAVPLNVGIDACDFELGTDVSNVPKGSRLSLATLTADPQPVVVQESWMSPDLTCAYVLANTRWVQETESPSSSSYPFSALRIDFSRNVADFHFYGFSKYDESIAVVLFGHDDELLRSYDIGDSTSDRRSDCPDIGDDSEDYHKFYCYETFALIDATGASYLYLGGFGDDTFGIRTVGYTLVSEPGVLSLMVLSLIAGALIWRRNVPA